MVSNGIQWDELWDELWYLMGDILMGYVDGIFFDGFLFMDYFDGIC